MATQLERTFHRVKGLRVKHWRFYLSRFTRSWREPPPYLLGTMANGLQVHHIGNTAISVVDGFCTADEAQALIECARAKLKPSQVVVAGRPAVHDRRMSDTATVFSGQDQNQLAFPILSRGASLTGLPLNHVERVAVTRYKSGGKFNKHTDYFPGYAGDRLYTILVYLNELAPGAGGETIFPRLNVSIRPMLGRAVIWANQGPAGDMRPETEHQANPVASNAVKWVIQLWYRRYPVFRMKPALRQYARFNLPNSSTAMITADDLPEGVNLNDRTLNSST